MTAVQLNADGVSLVVETDYGAVRILHWGPPVTGDPTHVEPALDRPVEHGGLDLVPPITVVPSHADGFYARPGVAGRRDGRDAWAPRFITLDTSAGEDWVAVVGVDRAAELQVETRIRLDPVTGAMHLRATLQNTGSTPYDVDGVMMTLPTSPMATEVLQFSGRWAGEFREQRRAWDSGSVSTENRRGRTSHDHVPLVFIGEPGFGESRGHVWGLHLAWSGNSAVHLEEMADGRRVAQLGELLLPGEVSLAPGETYDVPEIIAAFSSRGTNGVSQAFHRVQRGREVMPKTRPVIVNTWEAVYYDLDLTALKRLADRAAEVGAERLVLDDGWFTGRRNDMAGLGDWQVDPDIWPDGLKPLISHVTGLGLEFGIWVEPEMVSPDSDLYRAHPEWVLGGPAPMLGRNQLVLDLGNNDAYAHILHCLDALLRDHDIAYVKWDMNRDHAQPSSNARPGSRQQTLALYALLTELRRRHPQVTFESCASGGGRIDLGILQHAARVWTSDCNDPHERQRIQRGASHLIPPEVMGAHVGPPIAHTTRRQHGLAFRAATALFGHFGIEWNLLSLTEEDLQDVAATVELHKRFRPLLHSGVHHRIDHPWPEMLAQVVVAQDGGRALVQAAQLDMAQAATPPPLRIPGLNPGRRFQVVEIPVLPGRSSPHVARHHAGRSEPRWIQDGLVLTGSQLAHIGLQLPVLDPDTAMLIELTEVPADATRVPQAP